MEKYCTRLTWGRVIPFCPEFCVVFLYDLSTALPTLYVLFNYAELTALDCIIRLCSDKLR